MMSLCSQMSWPPEKTNPLSFFFPFQMIQLWLKEFLFTAVLIVAASADSNETISSFTCPTALENGET